VATGNVLENIRIANIELLESESPTAIDTAYKPLEGVYRERQVELAIRLFELLDISREDKVKREEWMQQNLRFHGAPAVLILSYDSSLSERTTFGVSAFAMTVCLAALSYGLGTCIQGVMNQQVIRRFTGIPETKTVPVVIAIGYPDPGHPANRLVSPRETVESFSTWRGFDRGAE